MRYWDASAIIPLCCKQTSTAAVDELLATDDEIVVWWGTHIECASALARLERDTAFANTDLTLARNWLRALAESWSEILASEPLRRQALHLLRLHPLRAADALQLAAAMAWAENWPAPASFVCLDERLRLAASKAGFNILPREGAIA